MPTCAKCKKAYHADYDGCPECELKRARLLYDIKSNTGYLLILTLIGVVVSVFAAIR